MRGRVGQNDHSNNQDAAQGEGQQAVDDVLHDGRFLLSAISLYFVWLPLPSQRQNHLHIGEKRMGWRFLERQGDNIEQLG